MENQPPAPNAITERLEAATQTKGPLKDTFKRDPEAWKKLLSDLKALVLSGDKKRVEEILDYLEGRSEKVSEGSVLNQTSYWALDLGFPRDIVDVWRNRRSRERADKK